MCLQVLTYRCSRCIRKSCRAGSPGLSHCQLPEQNAAETQYHAEYRVGHSYKCIAGLEQSHGFQRKAGECGEAAAEADLQEQNQPGIEMSAFNGKGCNVADAESAEYVDKQRHDRQAILRPQRDHTQQIAADSAARAAKTDE